VQEAKVSFFGLEVFGVPVHLAEIIQLIPGEDLGGSPVVLERSAGLPPFSLSAFLVSAIAFSPIPLSPLMTPPVFRDNPHLEQIHLWVLRPALLFSPLLLAPVLCTAVPFLTPGIRASGHTLSTDL
jgi:hypothetical protein